VRDRKLKTLMTKSKRKRESILVTKDNEIVSHPNYYINLKHGFYNEFVYELKIYEDSMQFLHYAITDFSKVKELDIIQTNKLHNHILRSTLIESFVILDNHINNALHFFQLRKLERPPNKIKHYSRVDDGLNEFLKVIEIPKELDSARNTITNYRNLRNQFAHYKNGIFAFNATQESFESFLQKREGFQLHNSFHCYIDGKAGVILHYEILSKKFISEFYIESQNFMLMLLEYLFSTDENKIFEFKT